MKNILIISSINPSYGVGTLPVDYYKAFKQYNYDVDFLTRTRNPEYQEFLYIYNEKQNKLITNWSEFKKRIIFKCLRIIKRKDYSLLSQRGFFCKYDKKPPISNKKLLNALYNQKNYDLVLIFFWHGMITSSSIEALYDKYKCSIFIMCEDYIPMTGGCHFIGDCKRFEKGCGSCEIWYSKNLNDFSYKNALEKIRIYRKVKPVFFMNKYMDDNYASKTPILKNARKEYIHPIVNEKLYCPINKEIAKKQLSLDKKKKIIFFACQKLDDPRKGGRYVIDALNIFYEYLSESERDNIIVMLAGKANKDIVKEIHFETISFGYVNNNMLIKLYQASDLYLSGSIIDAGPMMVNQALSCGVPVVSFYIGTAIQVINEKNTGYCAKEINSNAFADGIKWWYNLTDFEYAEVSNNCRKMALSTTSYDASVRILSGVYKNISK